MHKITQMQLANLKDEKEQITGKIAQYNKELEGSSDPESGKVLLGSEKEEIRRRLNVLEALTEINTRLRNTMEKPVSVKNMLEIQQIEIVPPAGGVVTNGTFQLSLSENSVTAVTGRIEWDEVPMASDEAERVAQAKSRRQKSFVLETSAASRWAKVGQDISSGRFQALTADEVTVVDDATGEEKKYE